MHKKEVMKQVARVQERPLSELVESSTNPRKAFHEERLEELAESIRSKGVLSPLFTRKVNGHFEIVSGARRYRAAQRAGLREVSVRIVRIVSLSDAETLEANHREHSKGRRASLRGSARVSRLVSTALDGSLPPAI